MTETITTRGTATVSAGALLSAVTHAAAAVSKKPSLPIMAGLRLSTTADRLHVTGFDYSLAITRKVPVEGHITDVLVAADTLQKALKALDKKAPVELAVTASEGMLVLTQGRRVINLSGMPMDEYPTLPDPTAQRSFTMTGEQVKFIADKVMPFSGTDDMLPVLNRTVQFDVVGAMLTVGSTDRFKAALAEMPVTADDDEFHFLVPDLNRFAPCFSDPEQTVVVGMCKVEKFDQWVTFLTEDATVTALTLDNEFPRLKPLFPSEGTLYAEFDPVVAINAVKFVSLAIERNTAVEVEIEGDHITFTGHNGDDTRMMDDVAATLSGRDADLAFRTGFNPAFLVDVLKVFGKNAVTMSTTSAPKPALFASESVPGLRVLLMPRRLVD